MITRSSNWLIPLLASLLIAASGSGEDARPHADEKCVEQCDAKSDECMAEAEGDRRKMQACDDQYSDCLQACG